MFKISKKAMIQIIGCLLISPSLAQANGVLKLVSSASDSKFGGHYLNIEKTMSELSLSRLQAHEIQNQMRDELEINSGSFSRVAQAPYVEVALQNAIRSVVQDKQNQGGFQPIDFKPGEFAIVLDLDETLLTQWYQKGLSSAVDREMSFTTTVRDTVPDWVDRQTGNSRESAELLYSPVAVQIRPGVEDFIEEVSELPGFRGFILFTAKEDKAAWAIYEVWKKQNPKLFTDVLGFYTRNYLRFDESLSKPSKDLRLFDPSLSHVFLIDDNEGRILQTQFNYKIPKFNPDVYIGSEGATKLLNEELLGYTALKIGVCAEGGGAVAKCLAEVLGTRDKGVQAISEYIDFVKDEFHMPMTLEQVQQAHIFEPEFAIDIRRQLSEAFPTFVNGQIAE